MALARAAPWRLSVLPECDLLMQKKAVFGRFCVSWSKSTGVLAVARMYLVSN